ERTDPAVDDALTARRRVDAGEQAQQRALAGAVVAENADAVSVAEFQVDAVERTDLDEGIDRFTVEVMDQVFLQRHLPLLADAEVQRDVVQLDAGHAKRGMRDEGCGMKEHQLLFHPSTLIPHPSSLPEGQRWKIRRFCSRAMKKLASPAATAMIPKPSR